MAKHIDVSSQLTRHQMLMDLAAAVKLHVDNNPDQSSHEHPEDEPVPSSGHYHSSR